MPSTRPTIGRWRSDAGSLSRTTAVIYRIPGDDLSAIRLPIHMTTIDPSVPRNGSPTLPGAMPHCGTPPRRLRHAFFARSHRAARRAFSLVEVIAVVSVMTVLAGLTAPAMKGLTGSNTLDSGVRKVAGLLSLARNEAIARHTVVRFVVATNWPGKTDANLRRVSLWAWDAHRESDGTTDRDDLNHYTPLTGWEELPVGVALDPVGAQSPAGAYLQTASYAVADATSVRGDYLLDPNFAAQEFAAGTGGEQITTRFIEFLPSGNLRIPGGNARQAILVATQGYQKAGGSLTYTTNSGNGQPANWAQVNVDSLTGRVRIYRP